MNKYYADNTGIFYTRSVYHDDVEKVYMLKFSKAKEQLENFLTIIRKEGADESLSKLRSEFSILRSLLGPRV